MCSPLKIIKVDTEEIRIMVCISLAMIPTIRKGLQEVKEACVAKYMYLNIKNIKIILSKFFLTLLIRVNEIEEALIAKEY